MELVSSLVSQSVLWLLYWLDDRSSVPGSGRDFSLCHHIYTDSWAYAAAYPVGTRGSFPGVKRPGRGTTTHFYVVLRLRVNGTIPPLPHTSSWRDAQLSRGTTSPFYLCIGRWIVHEELPNMRKWGKRLEKSVILNSN